MASDVGSSTVIQARFVAVHVKGQDGRNLYFSINENAKLSKMFEIYCERRQLDLETVRFLYEGNRITGDQTPLSLGLNDNDGICAFVHQFGGKR